MQYSRKLVLGGVYNFPSMVGGSYKLKVMLYDELEVLYDEWNQGKGKWLFNSFSEKGYYSRMPLSLLQNTGDLLEKEALTELEVKKHRPDLPLRLGRTNTMNWTNQYFETKEVFAQFLQSKGIDFSDNDLNIPEIILCPYSANGVSKKGEKFTASNGTNFTVTELLWYAQNLQSKYIKKESKGIGIYRLGIDNGMPSYYIGENYDAAGILLWNEKNQIP